MSEKARVENIKIFLAISLFVLIGGSFLCSSGASFIKRKTPDSTYAEVKRGETIFSTTDFRLENDRQRIVYKYWKFAKSDSKTLTLVYEEHLDFIKLQPDLKEEKSYTIGSDYTIRIQDKILDIYGLTEKSVIYYIKTGRE